MGGGSTHICIYMYIVYIDSLGTSGILPGAPQGCKLQSNSSGEPRSVGPWEPVGRTLRERSGPSACARGGGATQGFIFRTHMRSLSKLSMVVTMIYLFFRYPAQTSTPPILHNREVLSKRNDATRRSWQQNDMKHIHRNIEK